MPERYIFFVTLIGVVVIDVVVVCSIEPNWPGVFLGLLLGIGFSIPFDRAIRAGKVHTNQDGWITYADNPLRYLAVCTILAAGYVCGLLAPWLIKMG